MNSEGYSDNTAEKAMREYNRMPYKVKFILYHVNSILRLSGFEVSEIRHKKSGRAYKV